MHSRKKEGGGKEEGEVVEEDEGHSTHNSAVPSAKTSESCTTGVSRRVLPPTSFAVHWAASAATPLTAAAPVAEAAPAPAEGTQLNLRNSVEVI